MAETGRKPLGAEHAEEGVGNLASHLEFLLCFQVYIAAGIAGATMLTVLAHATLWRNTFYRCCSFGVYVARTAFAEEPPFSHRECATFDPKGIRSPAKASLSRRRIRIRER